MLTVIDRLLDKETVLAFRQRLEHANWLDGRQTAGSVAVNVKQNQQLADNDATAVALGGEILKRLEQTPAFISAALPLRIHPPKFNRYAGGGHYGNHVDNAIMPMPGSGGLFRSDLSATVFLCEPEEYDGGELTIDTRFGAQRVKLPAGSMVLYPSGSLHRVTPVTRGARICSFFWLQSMVADDDARTLLFDLDTSIRMLRADAATAQKPAVLQLSGTYHNLLRRWAKV
jgi:PKHD-type hydroxylase